MNYKLTTNRLLKRLNNLNKTCSPDDPRLYTCTWNKNYSFFFISNILKFNFKKYYYYFKEILLIGYLSNYNLIKPSREKKKI